jgi:hypothetical protein
MKTTEHACPSRDVVVGGDHYQGCKGIYFGMTTGFA